MTRTAKGGDYILDGSTAKARAEVRRALDASAFDWSAVPARVTIHIRPASTHLVLPIRRCPDRGRIVLPPCDEQVGAG